MFILCNFQSPPQVHHCSFLFSIRRSARVIDRDFISQFIPVAGIKFFLCGLSHCETRHQTAQIQVHCQLIINILSLDCDGMREICGIITLEFGRFIHHNIIQPHLHWVGEVVRQMWMVNCLIYN
jgi:hypothetical protein